MTVDDAASAPPDAPPAAVLFACTLNRVRSPMAAALMRRRWGGQVHVDSCGLEPGGEELDPFADAALRELGLGLDGHRSKTFADLQDGSFDLIVALSPEAHAVAERFARVLAAEVLYWPMPDPTAETIGGRDQRLAAYRRVRDELDRRLLERFGLPSTP